MPKKLDKLEFSPPEHPGKLVARSSMQGTGKKQIERFANRVGVSYRAMFNFISGKSRLSLSMAMKIANKTTRYTAKELLAFQVEYDLYQAGHEDRNMWEAGRARKAYKDRMDAMFRERERFENPGPFLNSEIVGKHKLDISQIAKEIGLEKEILESVLGGDTPVFPIIAFKLGKVFGPFGFPAERLLAMQVAWDLANVKMKIAFEKEPELTKTQLDFGTEYYRRVIVYSPLKKGASEGSPEWHLFR